MYNVDTLGQVFTPASIVQQMLLLRHNHGSILEPSCGEGAFFNLIDNCVAIEYDKAICPEKALNMDFFDYPLSHRFNTIIGNPPYVQYKKITEDTRKHLKNLPYKTTLNERANLFLYFLEKCLYHLEEGGEMIFITPRDFIKSTGALEFNKLLYSMGTITDWFDLGDRIIFSGFSPNCVIFRFEKDNFSRQARCGKEVRTFMEMNGQLVFTTQRYPVAFNQLFFVKVGAVSGADEYFIHHEGNMDFVYSQTMVTGKTRKMIYNSPAPALIPFKKELLERKIRNFNHENWYMWGRSYYESANPRIYVNVKTRKHKPFFIHPHTAYDGTILAIFPKFDSNQNLDAICQALNEVDWEELGFVCDGRYLFSQRSLEQIFLPEQFARYLNT